MYVEKKKKIVVYDSYGYGSGYGSIGRGKVGCKRVSMSSSKKRVISVKSSDL
jgi:hypothetical protein